MDYHAADPLPPSRQDFLRRSIKQPLVGLITPTSNFYVAYNVACKSHYKASIEQWCGCSTCKEATPSLRVCMLAFAIDMDMHNPDLQLIPPPHPHPHPWVNKILSPATWRSFLSALISNRDCLCLHEYTRDSGFRILNPGCKIQNPGSWIQRGPLLCLIA